VQEWLVTVGCGVAQPRITLRLIILTHGKTRRELLTNVLDPQMLSAQEALDLYPLRWTIERFFFDLKEVLGLGSLYAANPNAVAMQLYAAAMVHTAFRIAQSKIAQTHGLAPEALSTPKLFAWLAVASIGGLGGELYFEEAFSPANPGSRKPDWKTMAFAWAPLKAVLLERRNPRRKPPLQRTPMRWKSFAHIPGAELS